VTFLNGVFALTLNGVTAVEPCRVCGGEAPYQRGRRLSICPTCCVISVGNPVQHQRDSKTGGCMFCGTTEGDFTYDDYYF
jgi:hypothetical protein